MTAVLLTSGSAVSDTGPIGLGPGDLAGFRAYERQDYAAAHRALTPLAEKGQIGAQLRLFSMFHEGLGVERDPQKAAYWRDRAFQAGGANAAFVIANIYFQELDPWRSIKLTRDVREGRRWFERALNAGLKHAQRQLAIAYLRGSSYLVDEASGAKALAALRAATQSGDEVAACFSAYVIENGWGVEPDPVTAESAYLQAARLGSSAAYFRLAHLALADGTQADLERARSLLRQGIGDRSGADSSDDAAFKVSNWLAAKLQGEVRQNVFDGLVEAARACHPEAQYALAMAYVEGAGTKQDLVLALRWASAAVAVGHRKSTGLAQALERRLGRTAVKVWDAQNCEQYPLVVCGGPQAGTK